MCNLWKRVWRKAIQHGSWIEAGGWGDIPKAAIVHPACDQREMAKIKSGKVKLSDIWKAANK